MRVCFLIHELSRSGGMAMVRRHARELNARPDFEAELVLTHPKPDVVAAAEPGGMPQELDGVPLRHLREVGDRAYDVAVATWWTTAAELYEVRAARRAMFLQNVEHRFYGEDDPWVERMGAASVLALPIDYLVVASFMQRLLADLRPDARSHLVRYGIDKEAFSPRPHAEHDGPLRVLVEGQPSLWFKGVRDGMRAVRRMREPAEVTVVALDPSYARELGADHVVGGLGPGGMADLYARTDVLVKFARFEGFGLAPLEAFHLGVPCVVTPYTGHEEYVRHGENGLVVGFDDERGSARILDALARDRALLDRLSEGARRTAEGWPSAEQASERFAEALRLVAEADPPPPEASLAHLHRVQRVWIEQGRELGRQADVDLDRAELDLADHRERLQSIQSTRAYRLYDAGRRLAGRRSS